MRGDQERRIVGNQRRENQMTEVTVSQERRLEDRRREEET